MAKRGPVLKKIWALQPYLEWPRITPNVRFQGHAIIWRWILAKFQWQSIDTDTEVKCRVGCKSFNKLISCSKTIIECCDTVCIYHNTCLPSLVNICQTVFEKSPCNRFLLYISDIAGYAARSARSSACPASSSSRQASRYLASSYIWWICLGQKTEENCDIQLQEWNIKIPYLNEKRVKIT